MKSVPAGQYLLFALVAGTGVVADLVTKSWIFGQLRLGETWWLWVDYVGFQTSLNRGALFGMGQGLTWLFAGLSVAALVFIAWWLFLAGAAADRVLTLALGMVTGGILGNLYDRLGLWSLPGQAEMRIQAVRDWILVGIPGWSWPNFNIADSLLVVGAGVLLWHSRGGQGTPDPETKAGNQADQKAQIAPGQ